MNRWVTNSVVLALTILAGSTAYFATKANVLEKQLKRKTISTSIAASSVTTVSDSASSTPFVSAIPTETPSVSATASSVDVPAVSVADRLVLPSESYTVVEGDTLYPIGLKYDLAWQKIAEVNALSEPYRLTIGQVLAIPTVAGQNSVYEVRFTTNPTKASAAQSAAEAGKNTWRLDPLVSAQAELANVFGLTTKDDFRLESQDDIKGSASILATRLVQNQTKVYEILLVQPVTKGRTGIWSLDRVRPKS